MNRSAYFRKRYKELKVGTRKPMKRGRPCKLVVLPYSVRLAAATTKFMMFTANGVAGTINREIID